jgi:hypothetical protein
VTARRIVLPGLCLANGFAAGGLIAVLLVRQLLLTIMHRLVSAQAQAEILNVLDHLLPHTLVWAAACALALLLAAVAALWPRHRLGALIGLLPVAGLALVGAAAWLLGRLAG